MVTGAMSDVPETLPFHLDAAGVGEVLVGGNSWDSHVILPGAPLRCFVLKRLSENEPKWRLFPETDDVVTLNRAGVPADGADMANGDCIRVGKWTLQFWDGWIERLPEDVLDGFPVNIHTLSDTRGGQIILDNIDFSVHSGEFVGILGPSGCGKSSLIQRIAGVATWAEGTIDFGTETDGCTRWIPGHETEVAYVPQDASKGLHEELTVWQELSCHLLLRSAPSSTDGPRMSGALQVLGLQEERDKRVGDLSGGQQRRLAIALALLQRPRLLILDEPTSGLDPAAEAELMKFLGKLSKQGITVICSTHMLANIDQFSRVLVMDKAGKQKAFTEPQRLVEDNGGSLLGLYKTLTAATRRSAISEEVPSGTGIRRRVATFLRKIGRFFLLMWKELNDLWKEVWTKPMPCGAAFRRMVCGYILRQCWELTGPMLRAMRKFRHQSQSNASFKIGWKTRRYSRSLTDGMTALWHLVFLPLLMAAMLRFALRMKFDGLETTYAVVTFCASLAVFWLGMSHAVRLLVGERIPGRCLERLDGIGIGPYLVAKWLWCGLFALVQTSVFLVPFLLWQTRPEVGTCYEPKGFPVHLLVLSIVHWMGGAVGLAVSAIARREATALSCVPLLGMVALLFSSPVLDYKPQPEEEKETASCAEVLARDWMPCNPAQVLLFDRYEELEVSEKGELICAKRPGTPSHTASREDWKTICRRFLLYFSVSLAVAVVFQRLNEKKWEGR